MKTLSTMLRNSVWLSIVSAILVTPSAYGQRAMGSYKDNRQLPDKPEFKRVTELLEVINSGDGERVRKFVADAFTTEFRDSHPMDEHTGLFLGVRERTGGLDFYSVREYEQPPPGDGFVVIARGRLTESWRGIMMQVEKNPPYRIAGLQFSPARPPSDLPPAPKMSETQVVSELEKFLDRVVKADTFSGSVLLAKNGQVLFKKAYGEACKSFSVPNKVDTKFNIGSMNKMFTAVAVAQLVEKGKLSFQDKLSKYLRSDWLPADTADKITIEHLLTHTSGLGSYFNETFEKSSRELFRNVNDYKSLVSDTKLEFKPGSKWSYSNTGFLLAGAVIEKVTGQSYFDYIRKNIYEPAGMTNSDCYDMDVPVPNLAIGYTKEPGPDGKPRFVTNLFKHVVRGGPAGGGFSTVEDLFKFDQAMRANKLVSAKSAELLWSAKLNSPNYGYGFGLNGMPGNRIVGHSGGFPGINGNLEMFLDTGYTIAVLSNCDNGASLVSEKLREWLGQ